MPGPPVVPVQGDPSLPKSVDVVIVGGGIIGVSTALELADQGVSVALCEKGGIGHEQSSRNWGWVRAGDRDPRELPMMQSAHRIWEGLAQRTGHDLGYTRSGIIFAARTLAQLDHYHSWKAQADEIGVQSHVLSPAEFTKHFPNASTHVLGGLYAPGDGRAEPQKAAPAIAEAARKRGAAILTECAVRGFETAAGRISGVITEKGVIACSTVVVAGGAWSNVLCRRFGVGFPQLGVINSVLRTDPLPGGPEIARWSPSTAFRKRQDGGYTIADGSANLIEIVPDCLRYGVRFQRIARHNWRSLGLRLSGRALTDLRANVPWSMDRPSPFEKTRVLDPRPARSQPEAALARLAEDFPVFAKARIAQIWAGCIDVTPDEIPIVSAADALPGLFIATGFSGHGFGIGPGAGKAMADLVTGAPTELDTAPFRLSRFSDGSPIRLTGDLLATGTG